MKTPQEIAESIVPEASDCPTPLDWQRTREWLCRKISAAIQAERDANTPPAVVWTCKPPKGYVLTDEGVARRVLGELPMTADGVLCGPGVDVWHPSCLMTPMFLWRDGNGLWRARVNGDDYRTSLCVGDCYSTREAAEAAKNKEKP